MASIPGLRNKELSLMCEWVSYDAAEVCELVSTYVWNLLSGKYNKDDFGLHRDDGLTVLKNKSGLQSELIRKNTRNYLRNY